MIPVPRDKSPEALFQWARDLVKELGSNRSGGLGNNVSVLPAGVVLPFGGLEAPLGWALCEGQVLKQIDHRGLFKAIGTRYNVGTEAADEFRLPDGRGKVFRGTIAGDFVYGATSSVAFGSGPLANNNLNYVSGTWIIKL